MGISGLLPLLKSIQKPCHLRQFAGQTIGVDAYGWLHRGTAACAVALALDQPTTKYVDFAMNRVRMLIHFGVTPYLVFDGDYLPSKGSTERDRHTRREESKKAGLELLQLGKKAQAQQELQKAVDVTPEMAGLLIEQLKRNGIQYVVAPYEADSQLAYLERKGIIQGILSEDSDLLVFGARRLLTKLDQYGECVMIRRDDFTACREVSFVGWKDEDFRRMAILSGCDYLQNIGKMGLKTAHSLLRKHKTLERVIQAVQFEGKMKVPPGYLADFIRAEMTFLYQWVFCPIEEKMVNLTIPGSHINIAEMSFIGQFVDDKSANGVAQGELHPHTKKSLVLPKTHPGYQPPLIPKNKLQTQTTTSDLKKHKPIDTFFKPKRVPLAELDPNAFVLTPNQEQNARSINTLATPRGSNPATRELNRAPQTTPASTSSASARTPLSSSTSTPLLNRGKRPRLCEDDNLAATTSGVPRLMDEHSKFFGSKSAKSKRRKGPVDIEVFSDDSIEDALLALDATTWVDQKLSRSNTTEDSQATKVNSFIAEEDSQITLVMQSPSETDNVKNADFDHDEATLVETESTTKSGLFDKFLLQDLNNTEIKRQSSFTSVQKSTKKRVQTVITELQTSEGEADATCSQTLPRLEEGEADLEDSAWNLEDVIVPASDGIEPPTTPTRVINATKHSGFQGSEDHILSESEGEVSPVATPMKEKIISLKRFVFTAT